MNPATLNPLSQIASAQRATESPATQRPLPNEGQGDGHGFAQALQARSQPSGQAAHQATTRTTATGQQTASVADSTNTKSETSAADIQFPADPLQLLTQFGLALAKLADGDGMPESEADNAQPSGVLSLPADITSQIAASFLPANAIQAAKPAASAANPAGEHLLADLDLGARARAPVTAVTKGLSEVCVAASEATVGTVKDEAGGLETRHWEPTSFGAELDQAQQALTAALRGETPGHTPGGVARPHTIHTPAGSPGWADDVGQHLSWVASHDSGQAELVLTPAHLGRIEVSITMTGDQASASFVAASAAAREVLEDSLPRLREVLSQAGIQLGQANVSAGHGGQAQTNAPPRPGVFAGSTRGAGLEAPLASLRSTVLAAGNSLVDTFA